MNDPNAAVVQHTPFKGRTVAECLSDLTNVCAAGAQSPDVQNAPIAAQALATLQKAVTTANGSLNSKLGLALALIAAAKALQIDFRAVKVATDTYETAVNALAGGNATVISKAGLKSRPRKRPPSLPLGKVAVVHSKPGKHPGESIVNWPKAPGATGYAIEVNFTPQNPGGTYTALTSGTGRRRVIKGPAPAAQFLVRVAALGSDGTQSDWSDAILSTAA